MSAAICLDTPLGPVTLRERAGVLTSLTWAAPQEQRLETPLLRDAAGQLAAYFAGGLQRFDLPFDWGAGVQEKVRRAMAAIPFGQTLTYGEISTQLGLPAQAVGQACGANPLPIFIPCHRVLGAKGLGGFSAKGGVETKVWLLRHEGAAGLLI